MRERTTILFLVLASALLAGCASSGSGDTRSRSEVQRAYKVYDATVSEVRVVRLEGRSTQVGTLGGAWVGAEVGRTAGSGSGSDILGAVGGVAGAVIGRKAERQLSSDAGLEIILALDTGETVAVVQSAEVRFMAGERVRVLRDGSSARVVKRP